MSLLNPIRSIRLHQARTALLSIAAIGIGSSAVADFASQTHVEISFVATQDGVPVEGGFEQTRTDVEVDPAKPTGGKISVVIDTASVNTGSADADTMLRGRDFFDVARFPKATFRSTSIVADGAGAFRAIGEFTLKGRTLALVIPFSVRQDGAGIRFEGSVPLSRLAYKVGEGEWSDTGTLADQVLIKFKIPRQEGHLPRHD